MGALTRCPQCGYLPSIPKITDITSPQLCVLSSNPLPTDPLRPRLPNEESRLLSQEISRIDDTIRKLHEERAARCRRLNELQSPATNLPPNLLSTIFEYVCPPSEYNSSHQRVRRFNAKPLVLPIFALCAVSSHWRKVILSNPQFWAKLDWHWRYYLSPDDSAALLRAYFTRADPVPFDLKLTIHEKWEIENTIPYNNPHHIDGHLDALKQSIFFEHSAKIGSLKLDAPNRWLHLLSKSFVRLSDLSIRSRRIDSLIELSNLRSLQRITLMNIKITPHLPWKQITVIHLICPHINVALELLKRCSNLIEFRSQHPNPVRNGSITLTLKDAITLPNLELLEWSCIASLWDDALFRYMHFPSLRRLNLTGDAPWSHDWDHVLTNFFTRLPPSINLELGYIRDFTGEFISALKIIFYSLPSLQNLTLLEDDHDFLEKVLKLLTSSSVDHVICLPALRNLSLKSPNHEYAKDGVFTRLRGALLLSPAISRGDIFVDLMKQRRKVLNLPGFRLELDFLPQWRAESKDELIALVNEGFGLELIEKSKKVEWLPEVV